MFDVLTVLHKKEDVLLCVCVETFTSQLYNAR